MAFDRKQIETVIKRLKSPYYKGHRLPTTRRDFIRMGLIAGGGSLLPWNPKLWAQGQVQTSPTIPFLVFDLQGGAAMPGNFLIGQQGGPEDFCVKYNQHGWNPKEAGALDKRFGLPMSARYSNVLNGLLNTLPQAVIDQTPDKSFLQMFSICNFSLDDQPTNQLSALNLVSKSGLVGSVLKSGLGVTSSLSGAYSRGYLESSQTKPATITDAAQIKSLTSLGPNFLNLTKSQRDKFFSQLIDGAQSSIFRAAYENLSTFGDLHLEGDPRENKDISRVYNLNENVQTTSTAAIEAGIVLNVLKGFTGPGAIHFNECDYHNGPNDQFIAEDKDLEIGESIGRAVHSAHLLQKPLFFQIITDGGIYGPESNSYERYWIGDEPLHSATIVGYYDPNASVKMRRLQLGHYTPEGALQPNTNVGRSPEDMVKAVLTNYLSLHGLEGRIQDLTGIRMNSKDIDDVLAFDI